MSTLLLWVGVTAAVAAGIYVIFKKEKRRKETVVTLPSTPRNFRVPPSVGGAEAKFVCWYCSVASSTPPALPAGLKLITCPDCNFDNHIVVQPLGEYEMYQGNMPSIDEVERNCVPTF